MKFKDAEGSKYHKNSDFNKVMHYLHLHWKLFLIFGFIGFTIAFIFNSLKIHKYSVNTSILIPGNENTLDTRDLFARSLPFTKNSNIYDQIGIIKSFYTINQTLINLNWKTSFYKKDFLTWHVLNKNEPFRIIESESFNNPKGIKIYLTPLSDNSYNISANGTIEINNVRQKFKFEGKGDFDRTFVNQYFNFIVSKDPNFPFAKGNQYYFVFNDLSEETIAYYNKLDIELKDKKSNILECSIKGEDPFRDGEFLNELIKVYIKGKIELQNQAQLRSLEFINNQLSGISDSLNLAGERFSNFRSQNNIIDLGTEGTLIMNNLKDLESEKAQSQVQLDYFRDLLSYLKNNGDLNKVVSPSVIGIQDASLNSLVLKLSELYNRRQILSFSAKENNITVKLIDKELTQIRDQLNENLKNLIINASKSINSLKQRMAGISANLNRLPQKEQQLVSIQRQFNLTNEIYTFLLQRRAETNIALASRIPDVQVIDIARPETALPVGLSDKVILLVGFLLGIVIPLGFRELNSMFDITIQTQEDVENYTDIPIAGNILHDSTRSHLVVHENPNSLTAESFRTLRTNLQFLINGSACKIISVHSINPSEGKTFISKNLASILAMNQKKVLLIGADMRKPKIHRIFNLASGHGLSNFLIGKDKLDEVIFPTPVNNLWVIPSGPIPPNPSEILSKPEMKQMIETVCTKYDFIIIDNPPVGLVADGIIISQLSDLNLFILRHGFSHKYQPVIIDQYASGGKIDHMGIIVNDIRSKVFGGTYYKNFYYETYQKKYHSQENEDTGKNGKAKIDKHNTDI